MINQELEMFMRFDLPQAFREKFYPEMFKYFKFILPILKKGKHTSKNEMACVGSQYLHLYYLEQSPDVNFVVLRDEQGFDTVFKIKNDEIVVYQSHSENSFESRFKQGKKGISLNFKDLEELRFFVWNSFCDAGNRNLTKDILRKPKVSKVKNYSINDMIKKAIKNPPKATTPSPLFSIRKTHHGDFYVHSNERGSFKEELEVFRLINVMISGICSNNNIKFPVAMFSPDVEKSVAKLKASLK